MIRHDRKSGTEEKGLRVPYALSVYGEEEAEAVARLIREHKLIIGDKTKEFEQKVATLFGKKHGIMLNSGSSANLLATELLNLPEGSEVITPVLTFSTTVAPLLKKRLKPVYVDVIEGTYLINESKIEDEINDKTKALFIPSLIGNIPNLKNLRNIAKKHGLFFVDDSCDTLSATYAGRPTGTYTDVSTTSFYGSHIITAAGGGGMLCVNNDEWDTKARLLRGWGRSSAVNESEDIKRLDNSLGGMKYDLKYVFSEVGYNFLPLELQAVFGLEQLKKLKVFLATRKHNFKKLYSALSDYKHLLTLPKQDPEADTNWLAFPITIKEDAGFSRYEITKYLENSNIQTRPIFTGNILRQPGFEDTRLDGSFPVADRIMRNGFLVGCNQGLTDAHMDKLVGKLEEFLRGRG